MAYLIVGLILWVLWNWAAPYAVLYRAERISPGRLPQELFVWADARKARFYVSDLTPCFGYSIWAPPLHVVLFDKTFFRIATPEMVRFVVAHELAHFRFGHHWKRWVAVTSGIILFSPVRRWLLQMEEEADVEAERRTGISRHHVFDALKK